MKMMSLVLTLLKLLLFRLDSLKLQHNKLSLFIMCADMKDIA